MNIKYIQLRNMYMEDTDKKLQLNSKCYFWCDEQNLHNIIEMKSYNVLN
jgi:hypothetical protein